MSPNYNSTVQKSHRLEPAQWDPTRSIDPILN
jgi:hypothetical protein